MAKFRCRLFRCRRAFAGSALTKVGKISTTVYETRRDTSLLSELKTPLLNFCYSPPAVYNKYRIIVGIIYVYIFIFIQITSISLKLFSFGAVKIIIIIIN